MTDNSAVTDKKQRVLCFDILRILAIFFVMVLHVSSGNWYVTDVNSFQWQMMNFYDSISRWGVPVLVMISGALFLSRDTAIKKLYTKYILRIVSAFIVWSFVYSFIFNFVFSRNGISVFLTSFIRGHYHLWFLFMIVGLYMITPFLKKIVADQVLTKYFVVLAIVFAIMIPEALSIIKALFTGYSSWAESVVNQAHMKFVLGFSVYYILGYYLSRVTLSRKAKICIYGLGVIGFASTVLFSTMISKRLNEANAVFYESFSVNVFCEAVCVFVFVRSATEKMRLSDRSVRIITALSKYSFGAYLIHALIITLLSRLFGLDSLAFNTALSIPLISVMVFTASFAISALLNRIPIVRKYLV